MTNSKQGSNPRKKATTNKRSLKNALFLTLVSAIIVLLLLFYFFRPDVMETLADKPASSPPLVEEPGLIENSVPNLDTLIGRWIRPDGGYILEILSASPEGILVTGYFNPNAINVGRSEWAVDKGLLYVMVELQDVNYPGSTYGLQYDPSSDQLVGKYFQAVDESTYDVLFEREK